jgi:hypothetical protein
MSLPKVNRGVPDIRVMYDIAVAKGQYSDSEQRAIESGNTSYVANENAHLWHDKKSAGAKAHDATSNTTAPVVGAAPRPAPAGPVPTGPAPEVTKAIPEAGTK